MFLDYRYFAIIGCFFDQKVQEKTESKYFNNTLSFGNSDGEMESAIMEKSSTKINICDQTKAEMQPGYTNECALNFNIDSQFQNDKFSLSHNFIKDCNSGYENFVIQCNPENYLNNHLQSSEDTPNFATTEPQNNVASYLSISENRRKDNKNYLESEFDVTNICNASIQSTNYIPKNDFSSAIKIDEEILQNEACINKNEIKTLKTSSCNLQCSMDQSNLNVQNFEDCLEIQNHNEVISEQESIDQDANQSFDPIKRYNRRLRNAMYNLNTLKTHEAKFLNPNIRNGPFYLPLYSNFKELTEVTEYIFKLCKKWVEKKISIEDSMKNVIAYEDLYRLALDARSSIIFFKKIIENATELTWMNVKFNIENKKLELKIQKIKKLLEQLKLLEIDKMLEDDDQSLENENQKDILIGNAKMRDINFIYQEENNLSVQNFKIYVKKELFPVSLSLFEDSIFLCIRSKDRYLKILNVDLHTRKHIEINKYLINEEGKGSKLTCFGFGSRYTIIRSGSEGKLFLLKSPLGKTTESRLAPKKLFEMLAVNKEFKKLACIQVDRITLANGSVIPAIIDFTVSNDLVYALDIKIRCIKIFNENLELLKTIPIPEKLTEVEDAHLAVSSRYILIGACATIYYVENSDQYSEFKKLELDRFLHNIAFYNEEYVILRFVDCCYSFKIEENSSNVRYVHLSCLDQLKGLSLSTFIIKDNFVYSLCVKTHQIYKLCLTFNSMVETTQ